MTDDDVLEAVAALVESDPQRAVSTGEVCAALATGDEAEVSMHLEQLRENGHLFRSVGSESDQPPAIVTYTLYR